MLLAKRKLNIILRSISIAEMQGHVGKLVQIFICQRGSWSSPKPVLSFDSESQMVCVPGSEGRAIKAAVEDVCHAVTGNALAVSVQDASDQLPI